MERKETRPKNLTIEQSIDYVRVGLNEQLKSLYKKKTSDPGIKEYVEETVKKYLKEALPAGVGYEDVKVTLIPGTSEVKIEASVRGPSLTSIHLDPIDITEIIAEKEHVEDFMKELRAL